MNFKTPKKIILISSILTIAFAFFIYKKDKSKYEPKLWIGLFDYRLNFRDLGASLNACQKEKTYKENAIYRSNKYFSGWSCDKIQNPDKIYSLNYSINEPHSYFCLKTTNDKLYGIHPNTTFELNDIENLQNWKQPAFKETMCSFFKSTFDDIKNKRRFLFHCDVGRDRTGAFAALLSMALSEEKHLDLEKTKKAIECDYEKTSALEEFKKGHMLDVLNQIEKEHGGVSNYLQKTCGISEKEIQDASNEFIQ